MRAGKVAAWVCEEARTSKQKGRKKGGKDTPLAQTHKHTRSNLEARDPALAHIGRAKPQSLGLRQGRVEVVEDQVRQRREHKLVHAESLFVAHHRKMEDLLRILPSAEAQQHTSRGANDKHIKKGSMPAGG
jgi:hypothetical protein